MVGKIVQRPSAYSDQPSRRVLQLPGVVADARAEHGAHLVHIGRARRGIAEQDDEVGLPADGHRPHLLVHPEDLRPVECEDLDRLARSEAGLEQIRNQLRSIYKTMDAGGIRPGSPAALRLFG